MRYYIADCHFFHAVLNAAMDQRGFDSVEEMNETMIERWNSKVRKNDEVVVLGDFSWGKADETNEILRRLHGKLFLIQGNHDRFLKDKNFHAERFEWVKEYAELSDNGRKVILCHYPMPFYNNQYRLDEQGNPKSYMLYGHVHDTYDEVLINQFQQMTRGSKRVMMGSEEQKPIPCNMINCFCMYSDYMPLTLDEWIELDAKRRAKLCELQN